MRLPPIELDDRRFQDLVSEARLRINRACPEWTEHNVSDPGITLIELFAWMTELTIYRLNRVPDKLHVTLMELLGIRLDGPTAAHTRLRFRLAAPADRPVDIAGGDTEVGTLRTATEESVVFQVDDDFTIPPPGRPPTSCSAAAGSRDIGISDGRPSRRAPTSCRSAARRRSATRCTSASSRASRTLIVRVDIEASTARGAGVNPEDPPLRWEVSGGDGDVARLPTCSRTSPGGFNYGSGTVELQCPQLGAIEPLAGQRLHWLRCRIDRDDARRRQRATYTQPPEIYAITAAPIGALLALDALGAAESEMIGVSDGTPGQIFPLRNVPVLTLGAGETLEVQDPDAGDWERWELRENFVGSTESTATSTSTSSPARSSSARRSARPTAAGRSTARCRRRGRVLRFSRYRHGGGRDGNVAAGTRSRRCAARSPASTRSTNPTSAIGGVDAEPLDHARARASMEIRTRYRAVTAEDFEFLAGEASPRVARAVCLPPSDGSAIPLHVVPRLPAGPPACPYEELVPDEELLTEVAEYLDARRLIGTQLQLLPCKFRGLSVVVNLQASPLADTGRVEEDVAHALYTYLNPLVGGNPHGLGGGWAFGRALNQGELYGIVHAVDGVEFVKILRIYETDLITGEQSPKLAGTHIVLEPDELIASGQHIVKATHREQ